MTPESLARTIAKARHGTDAMWANYMGAAEAVRQALMDEASKREDKYMRLAVRALIAQPDSAQEDDDSWTRTGRDMYYT